MIWEKGILFPKSLVSMLLPQSHRSPRQLLPGIPLVQRQSFCMVLSLISICSQVTLVISESFKTTAFGVHVNVAGSTPTLGPWGLGLPEGLPVTLKYSAQLRNRWPPLSPTYASHCLPEALLSVRYGVLQTMESKLSILP